MIRFTGTLDVDCAPEVAFDALADMSQISEWNPNVVESALVSGEPLTVGSTYSAVIRRGPLRMAARPRLVAVDPGRHVEYEGTIGGFWSVDSLSFEAVDGGTRITFFNETKPPAILKLLGPVMNAAFQPQARKAVAGARGYLESAGC